MSKTIFKTTDIAPCGMNCGVCIAFLRRGDSCERCRKRGENMPHHCIRCIIKKCPMLANTRSGFCYECQKFPCRRMKTLNARYEKNYKVSLIGNLERIEEFGIRRFLSDENAKWTCKNCGGILSIHRTYCLACKRERE